MEEIPASTIAPSIKNGATVSTSRVPMKAMVIDRDLASQSLIR